MTGSGSRYAGQRAGRRASAWNSPASQAGFPEHHLAARPRGRFTPTFTAISSVNNVSCGRATMKCRPIRGDAIIATPDARQFLNQACIR